MLYSLGSLILFLLNIQTILARNLPVDISVYPTIIIDTEDGPRETNYLVEGDMVMTKEHVDVLYNGQLIFRNGIINEKRLWPNQTVYYRFEDGMTENRIQLINSSMAFISNVSCIRFEVAPPARKGFVLFRWKNAGRACSAVVGYTGGKQHINLPYNYCYKSAALQHEIMHALGFYHQHNAADRDNWVRIRWENMQEKLKKLYRKNSPYVSSDYGAGYDYKSIMHYPKKAGNKNNKVTIEVLHGWDGLVLGYKPRLSEKDILKLNRMYKCKGYEKW